MQHWSAAELDGFISGSTGTLWIIFITYVKIGSYFKNKVKQKAILIKILCNILKILMSESWKH